MNIVGITGSSGAGKSTVCDILQKKYHVRVINADKIAKRLSKSGTKYINEIAEKFGKNILDKDGELKRRELAEIIYTDPEKRKSLNSCTFKYIQKEIQKEIEKEIEKEISEESVASTIVIDAPLLFESELDKICNCVIGVISQKNLQIERIIVRDNVDYEHAEKRLSAQEPNKFYIDKCDEIIENNNDMFYIEKRVNQIAQKCNITKRLQ